MKMSATIIANILLIIKMSSTTIKMFLITNKMFLITIKNLATYKKMAWPAIVTRQKPPFQAIVAAA